MIFELKVALRFMRSGKSQTIFIVAGIALGVAVMIFLGLLITSLQDSLVDETIGNSAHITISNEDDSTTQLLQQADEDTILLRGNYSSIEKNLNNWTLIVDEIKQDERVKAISPVLLGTGLVRSSGKDKSVQIKGIDLTQADPIYEISPRLVSGTPSVEGNNVLIGTKLAENLGLKIGDNVTFLLPSGNSVQLFVSGIFDLQNETVNSSLVFMDLKRAQKLFNSGSAISAIEVQITEPFEADIVAEEWSGILNGVKIEQWKELNAQLLSALSSQGSSSYTIQFFVIISITFGISSVLAVSVVQKSKEIGILKAMGTTKKGASRIFVYQGLILGVLGSVIGIFLGIILLFFFNTFASTGFAISYDWGNILLVAAIATVAGTLASVIPARRSAELNPMEAIKNG